MAEAERLRSKHKKDFPDYKYQPRRRKPMKSLGQSQPTQQQQQQSSSSSSSEGKSESSEASSRSRSSRSYSSSYASRTAAAYSGGQCPPTPPATPSSAAKTRSYPHASDARSRSAKSVSDSHVDSAFSKTSSAGLSNGSIKYNVDPNSGSVLNPTSHPPPALEAYMHHIVGLSPHTSHNVPTNHPSSQYSHFVGPAAGAHACQGQGPSPWSRPFESHHYLSEPPVTASSVIGKDASLPDLYRDYGGSSIRHSTPAGQATGSSFMDASAQSSLLAGMSVFTHDPFSDNRSSSDAPTSCVYGNPHPHASLGHHFLTPR